MADSLRTSYIRPTVSTYAATDRDWSVNHPTLRIQPNLLKRGDLVIDNLYEAVSTELSVHTATRQVTNLGVNAPWIRQTLKADNNPPAQGLGTINVTTAGGIVSAVDASLKYYHKELGVADVDIEASIIPNGGGSQEGILFRSSGRTDQSYVLSLRGEAGNTGLFLFLRTVNGNSAVVTSFSTAVTPGVARRIRVVAKAGTISGYIDGNPVASLTFTDTLYTANTKHGIGLSRGGILWIRGGQAA